jgi:hypothetical protein
LRHTLEIYPDTRPSSAVARLERLPNFVESVKVAVTTQRRACELVRINVCLSCMRIGVQAQRSGISRKVGLACSLFTILRHRHAPRWREICSCKDMLCVKTLYMHIREHFSSTFSRCTGVYKSNRFARALSLHHNTATHTARPRMHLNITCRTTVKMCMDGHWAHFKPEVPAM